MLCMDVMTFPCVYAELVLLGQIYPVVNYDCGQNVLEYATYDIWNVENMLVLSRVIHTMYTIINNQYKSIKYLRECTNHVPR